MQMRNFQQVPFQYRIDWICCWATKLIYYYGMYHRDQVWVPLVKLFWSWNKVVYFQNCKSLSAIISSWAKKSSRHGKIVIVLNISLIWISEGRGKDLFYTGSLSGLPTSLCGIWFAWRSETPPVSLPLLIIKRSGCPNSFSPSTVLSWIKDMSRAAEIVMAAAEFNLKISQEIVLKQCI